MNKCMAWQSYRAQDYYVKINYISIHKHQIKEDFLIYNLSQQPKYKITWNELNKIRQNYKTL